MSIARIPLVLNIALWSVLLASGCASPAPYGSFLTETQEMHETDLSQGMYVQFDTRMMPNYDAYILEPLKLQLAPQKPVPVFLRDPDAVDPAYRSTVGRALAEGGMLTPSKDPGAGVLLVKAAVTSRYQQDPEYPAPGPATLELEAVDSISLKRVFAVMDPALGARDSGGEYTEPHHAFARFARRLRMRIDEAPLGQQ